MSAPSHSIVPITKDDIPTLAKLLCDSKLQLTINRLLFKDWPNEVAQVPNYTMAVEGGFVNPDNEAFKAIDDKGESKCSSVRPPHRTAADSSLLAVLGHLALTRIRPKRSESATVLKGDQKVPDHFNRDIFAWVMKTVGEIDEDFKGIDHYGETTSPTIIQICAKYEVEVTHIYVKPMHRRRGIGSQLMKLCLAKAKADGVPLVSKVEPGAYEYFSKHGFKDTKHGDIDLSKFSPPYTGFGLFRLAGMVVPT